MSVLSMKSPDSRIGLHSKLPEKTAVTSAERIRLALAKKIVTGELLPGTPLDETQIAADFAVSRTPVREALKQLASSGLIEQRAHRKSVVTQPDAEMLEGIFEVMAYLEALCAGLSALNMNSSERAEMQLLHGRMQQLVHAGDGDSYVLANETFHNLIYDGSHNAYLAEVSRATRQRLQPFRRAQFGTLGRLSASHAEHTAIVEAILRGDRAGADTAMRGHIGLVEQSYYRYAGGVSQAS